MKMSRRNNDRPVQLRTRRDGDAVMLEAKVHPELLYEFSDRVRITLAVAGISVPHDKDPDNPERRPLGLALDAITLTPATDPATSAEPWTGDHLRPP